MLVLLKKMEIDVEDFEWFGGFVSILFNIDYLRIWYFD